MEKLSQVYVGVDISKNHLDVSVYPQGKFFKVENNERDIISFLNSLKERNDIVRIACESSGGYEKRLAKLLKERGHILWVIDPRRIKGFIASQGKKAKTDKIDAQKIAEFTFKNEPDFDLIEKTEQEEQLSSLVKRRQDLVKMLAAEKTRLKQPIHEPNFKHIKKAMVLLEKLIATIEAEINEVITAHKELTKKSKILESIPGIGRQTSALLISFVPELGKLNGNKISALLGVCPYNNESGTYRGKRFIRGGKIIPRNALYMCALTTIKHNLILKAFYDRLVQNGKPFKVAIVAVMRKLIILANSLLKRGELCNV